MNRGEDAGLQSAHDHTPELLRVIGAVLRASIPNYPVFPLGEKDLEALLWLVSAPVRATHDDGTSGVEFSRHCSFLKLLTVTNTVLIGQFFRTY